MTTSTRRFQRWTVAAAGALTLGLLSLAGPASADVNIDPDAIGSITVTKLIQPNPALTSPDGTAQDITGLDPVEGVTFEIQEVLTIGGVAVDFTTEASWLAAEALDPATGVFTLGPILDTQITDVDGVLTFDLLPVGLYLITETDAPDDITTFAAPFLVSIPLPLPSDTGPTWLYDVFVYPKNSTATVDKTVDDSEAIALGDEITWTLSGGIPALPQGQTLTEFTITDMLDSRLEYVADSAAVTAVDNAGVAIALTEGIAGDYTIDYTAQTLTVEFTATGLAKLSAAGVGGPNAAVTLTFDTVVISIGDGTIYNTGVFNIGDATFEDDAYTEWGALKILKYADPDVLDVLEGAEFSVYETEADAIAGTDPISVLVGGVETTVFTTAADGTVVIPGLKAPGTYYVKEVTPPDGYLANDTVYEVDVTVGSIAEAAEVQVPNDQVPPIDLPLTGANGTILFSLAGLGLMAVAGGAAMKHRSRSMQAR